MLFRSLLNIAGCEVPETMQGRSLIQEDGWAGAPPPSDGASQQQEILDRLTGLGYIE